MPDRLCFNNYMATYDREFFEKQQAGSLQSANEVVPFVCERLRPHSVVDVGCGVGTWASVFARQGIRDVVGVDGEYVDRALLQIAPDAFLSRDLTKPLELGRAFDLVVSLEVAEHLPPESADTFVASLTALGPVVLFSAAIPHQIGVNHVNEQWPDYWIAKFTARGYVKIDRLRQQFWDNACVSHWYAQNMFLFAEQAHLQERAELRQLLAEAGNLPSRLVHPRQHLSRAHFVPPPVVPPRRVWPPPNSSLRRGLRRLRRLLLQRG